MELAVARQSEGSPAVLQVNVRYAEGGAAQVARTIAAELQQMGYRSDFAYGYGPHGQSSKRALEDGAMQLGSRGTAAANLIAHRVSGRDAFSSKVGLRNLKLALQQCDLVHLHVIHSYMLAFEKLINELILAGKPVVWTLHDQWLFTGRCAQPGHCGRWRMGCYSCPDLAAYPRSYVDNARQNWADRRKLFEKLRSSVDVQLVACAPWLSREAADAGLNSITIPNSVDSDYFNALTATPAESHAADRSGLLFLCRDLRDSNKVNISLLSLLNGITGGGLTIVGDNPPTAFNSCTVVPAINNREQLVNLMLSKRTLVFTSTVDYHPLTVIEALAAGLEVLAIRSPATQDLSGSTNLHLYDSDESLIQAANQRREVTAVDLGKYSPLNMATAYATVYEALLYGNAET